MMEITTVKILMMIKALILDIKDKIVETEEQFLLIESDIASSRSSEK